MVRGRVGRAISASSYLIKQQAYDVSPVDLVWALLAIEALSATGNEGLKNQLMTKSELLLGKRFAYKKRFQRIYDFRSRFVHGDIDFGVEYSLIMTIILLSTRMRLTVG